MGYQSSWAIESVGPKAQKYTQDVYSLLTFEVGHQRLRWRGGKRGGAQFARPQ